MNRHRGLPHSALDKRFEKLHARGNLPRGYIDGLILSNDTTDATNDIAIAAGSARSTVNIIDGVASTLTRDQMDLDLPVGIIKQLDVAWAPENYDEDGYSGGDRSGGRSASAISNTTWHTYAIGGPGVPTDVMFHDSATQSSVLAALPGGYTAARRGGSVVRAGGTILGFIQRGGDKFILTTPVLDISATNPGTSAVTRTLSSIPTGVIVEAIVNASMRSLTSGSIVVYLSSLETANIAPSHSVAPLGSMDTTNTAAVDTTAASQHRIFTNTSAQIRSRLSASGANDVLRIATIGWVDTRERDI